MKVLKQFTSDDIELGDVIESTYNDDCDGNPVLQSVILIKNVPPALSRELDRLHEQDPDNPYLPLLGDLLTEDDRRKWGIRC